MPWHRASHRQRRGNMPQAHPAAALWAPPGACELGGADVWRHFWL